jgi:hypothetical protein
MDYHIMQLLLKDCGPKLHVIGGPDPYDGEEYDKAVQCARIYERQIQHERENQALLGFNTDEYTIDDPSGTSDKDKHPFMLALPLEVYPSDEIVDITRNNGTSHRCRIKFNKPIEEYWKLLDAQKADKSQLLFFTYRVDVFDDVLCRLFVGRVGENGKYQVLP